jgi:hypothetical protein
MDKVMADNGYIRVGGHSAEDALAKGVDAIYKLSEPSAHPGWPEYVVGEAKFGDKSGIGVQLEKWYLEGNAFPREDQALVSELIRNGYGRVVSRVMPDGTVKVTTFGDFIPPRPG